MEVDMHSPSFRELRSYSNKRCRSPDTSPSSLERHSKRISLAADSEFIPSPTIPQHTLPGSTSASTSRFSSEDWVKQADGLTIDSPLLPNVPPGVAPQDIHHDTRQETMDDIMTMDSEESMSMYRPQLPLPRSVHRPQAPHIQITTTSSHPLQQQYHHSDQLQNSFLNAPPQHVYSMPLPANVPTAHNQAPMICVLPATPADSPIRCQNQAARPQTPPSASQVQMTSPMALSPTNSSMINRKQRFTMGPRSDCEKCRLGVKGHWMHFD